MPARFTLGRFLVAAAALNAAPVAAQSGAVRGRVTDSTTGRPVAGARLEIRRDGGATFTRATTERDGSFISAMTPGQYEIFIRAIGYAPARIPNLAVRAGDTTSVAAAIAPFGIMLNPEVVSVSRTQERTVDAPASVTVVTPEQIEQRPAPTPIEHARDAPGVDLATTGIIQSHIVTRGFNGVFSGALLVLTDNRYGFVPSLRINTPWLLPDVNADVDRIEIVLGPGAALYGPNATAGVLQIFTKPPLDFPGTTVSVAGFARGGNATSGAGGARQLAIRHAATLGQRFGYKVSAQYLAGSDWSELDSVEVASRQAEITRGADERTLLIGKRDFAVERWTATARADYRANDDTEMSVAAGRARAGSAIELTGLGAFQVRGWTYDYLQARLRHDGWTAQAFVNLNDAGKTYPLRTGIPIVDRSRMYVAQLQSETRVGARHTVIYGLDAQRTNPRTDGTQNGRNENDDDIDEAGAYVQSETQISPRLELVAAGRIDYNNRLPSFVVSPRVAVVVKPSDSHTLRLSFNRAFETPTTDNLFLDYVAGTLAPAPYLVRAIGVPAAGLSFRRDCSGGLCMRSPFASSSVDALPVDGTLVWRSLVEGLNTLGIADLRGVPTPAAADVRSELRVLNTADAAHPRFDGVTTDAVRDVPALRERIVNTFETGYKGIFGEHLRLAFDVYYEHRTGFVAPPAVETPNVFFVAGQVGQSGTLANYLGRYMAPSVAQAIATKIAGVAGSASDLGVPLGTVAPEGPMGGSPDVLLTFRNSGSLHRWGTDVGAQWLPTADWTLTGAISWTNKDLFRAAETGGLTDLALNAPRRRLSIGIERRDRGLGLTTYARGRLVAGFPMRSGLYSGDVPAYTTGDAGLAYRSPRRERVLITISAQNLFGAPHREFIGAPMIGRLVIGQLQYTVR